MPLPLLLTMPPSHFSEKARWALQRANVDFEESRNPPLFHRLANRRHRGGGTVPVLVLRDQPHAVVLDDSSKILRYADRHLKETVRLYPDDPELQEQVCKREEALAYSVGRSVIRFAYFHLLPHRDVSLRLLTEGTETSWHGWKKRLFTWLFPLVRAGMWRGLKLGPEQTSVCWGRIQRAMDELADQLGDGRPYLLGDRFTAADLTAAALLAPLALQPGYGGSLVRKDEVPESMRFAVTWVRQHPVHLFVERIYAQHRGEVLRGGSQV
jgi:glutathione S-transferase